MMARLYFDKKSNFRGYSVSLQEFILLYIELAKLIFFLAIIAAGLYLAAAAFGGLTAYVTGYEKLDYPHKATGGFYYYLLSSIWALISGPYLIGSAIAASSISPWSNLNLVIGILTGLTLYTLLLVTPAFLRRVVRFPSKSVVVLLILAPGFLSLIYFLIAAAINWLFHTDHRNQIQPTASVVTTPSDKIPAAVIVSKSVQLQPIHDGVQQEPKANLGGRETDPAPNKKAEISDAGLSMKAASSLPVISQPQNETSQKDMSANKQAKLGVGSDLSQQGERSPALDPRTRCANKENFISRGICESRACQKPEYSRHSYCDVIRQQSEK